MKLVMADKVGNEYETSLFFDKKGRVIVNQSYWKPRGAGCKSWECMGDHKGEPCQLAYTIEVP